MKITQRVEGDVTVFLPEGRIDTLAADEMDQALQAAVAGGSHKIVVDMSGVDYISSAGLRSLAAVLVKSRAEGGDMKIAALNERVTRVFNIIGFDLLMSLHETSDAAIADFSHPELPISSCLDPSNAPSSTRAIVVSLTDAVNHPVKLTKPSLGVVS